MTETQHKTLYLKDYQAPEFFIDNVYLSFDLEETHTLVYAELHIKRNSKTDEKASLFLNGEDLTLQKVFLNDKELKPEEYQLDTLGLTIPDVPDSFILKTTVKIHPDTNKELSGLYISNHNYCTQCESQGFRRITYFIDRPDVMARYKVSVTANKAKYPILLSNGNLIETKELPDGKHCTIWQDPSKKPCYLFALVAGDFDELKDQFETRSGKMVDLYLYVEKGYADQADYALACLKQAMKWDEETFGREYDLDRYTIVAVSDFNAGAMENKALNIFNAKYILAKPETAVDDDYVAIEAVIGHEYFHNWTGDRITCRDWFQLTLKEGLTVLRDQLFTEDRTTKLMGRIKSASLIRNRQFSEETGPTAHPIRPDSYMAVDNLYTLTVYYKGAEVIRMIRTLVGEQGFRKGMDLYFKQHDGQAVTTEEFVKAMEEANNRDFTQFKLWYSQKGIPILEVRDHYDAQKKVYRLTVKQKPPVVCGKPLMDSKPFHLPLKIGLLDQEGNPLQDECVLEIKEKEHQFSFEDIDAKPIPSLLRHFSAPVQCDYDYSNEQLALLMNKDPDAFNRWLAGQTFMTRLLLDLIEQVKSKQTLTMNNLLLNVFADLLNKNHQDYYLIAQLLSLPTESYLIGRCEQADVEAIHVAYQFLKQQLGIVLEKEWLNAYQTFYQAKPYQYNRQEMARRTFQNLCLNYLLMNTKDQYYQLALKQVQHANNMTDSFAALTALNDHTCDAREQGIQYFYQKWQHEPLVMDKWLALQASSTLPNTLEKVKELMKLPVFNIYNPNKVRALISAFSLNPVGFHQKDGAGYQFLVEQVMTVDQYNRQLAGRLIEPLIQWRKYEKTAQEKMKAELNKLKNIKTLSANVYELVEKALQD